MYFAQKYITVGRSLFATQAKLTWEYAYDFANSGTLLKDLKAEGIDIFSFVGRPFLSVTERKNESYLENRSLRTEYEGIGVITTSSYEAWFKSIPGGRRRIIRQAERRGIQIRDVQCDDKFLEGALAIHRETPIRQGHRFTEYGVTFDHLKREYMDSEGPEILGAYDGNKLVGYIRWMPGDRAAQIGTFLHLISARRKRPMNALVASLVKRCCEKGIHFIVYITPFGFQPGLDRFRASMGFKPSIVPRTYIPLTRRGYTSIRLKIHKPIRLDQYVLPYTMAKAISPIYSKVSSLSPSSITDHVYARAQMENVTIFNGKIHRLRLEEERLH
jgi:hypothetical protein